MLVFEGVEDRSLAEFGVLLRDIDTLYWLCVEVIDDVPTLKERIAAMRGSGSTLQAIADRLNEEGVPTLRGGQKWRPSSVQGEIRAEIRPARPEASYLRPRVKRIQLGSPSEISLELAEVIWRAGVGFTFAGALAMIFKLPASFQKEREEFWQTRLAADQANREWIEWTRAQYRESPIRLDDLILPEEAGKYLP